MLTGLDLYRAVREAKVGSASEKAVLFVLASRADDACTCYPSAASIGIDAGLSARRVQDALSRLVAAGHITMRKRGQATPLYTVHPKTGRSVRSDESSDQPDCPTGRNVAPRPDDSSDKLPSELPKSQRASPSSTRGMAFPPPVGVDREVWRDFQRQRKKRLTPTAYHQLAAKLGQLADDGWPPGEMVALAVERGWETVWAPREQGNGNGRTTTDRLRGARSDSASRTLAAGEEFVAGAR